MIGPIAHDEELFATARAAYAGHSVAVCVAVGGASAFVTFIFCSLLCCSLCSCDFYSCSLHSSALVTFSCVLCTLHTRISQSMCTFVCISL
jgi:hypothetical protein